MLNRVLALGSSSTQARTLPVCLGLYAAGRRVERHSLGNASVSSRAWLHSQFTCQRKREDSNFIPRGTQRLPTVPRSHLVSLPRRMEDSNSTPFGAICFQDSGETNLASSSLMQRLDFSSSILLVRYFLFGEVVGYLIVPHTNCSSLITAHSRAHLILSIRVTVLENGATALLLYPGSQDGFCRSEIHVLRALGFVSNGDTRGFMSESYGRSCFVSLLPTLPRTSEGFPLDIPFDLDFFYFDWIKNCHRDGRSLNSTSFLGRRNSLPPMTTGFLRESLFGVPSSNFQDRDRWTLVQDFEAKDPSARNTFCRWQAAPGREAWHHLHLLRREFQQLLFPSRSLLLHVWRLKYRLSHLPMRGLRVLSRRYPVFARKTNPPRACCSNTSTRPTHLECCLSSRCGMQSPASSLVSPVA